MATSDYTLVKIPSVKEDLPEQINWLHKQGNLHPACYDCINRKKAEADAVVYDKFGKPLYEKGQFVIDCQGIPLDYTKLLPANVWNNMSLADQHMFRCTQDPVYWAYKYLNWWPRSSKKNDYVNGGIEYQAILLRCTSRRKISRIGRRSGKTAALAVYVLWHAFVHSSAMKTGVEAAETGTNVGNVLIVTPFGRQSNLIFEEIRKRIQQSTVEFRNAIIRNISHPFELKFVNGSRIMAATSGEKSKGKADSIRGEGAGLVMFDEMDSIGEDSINTLTPIWNESETGKMWGSGTPSGSRDTKFYAFCNSPVYVEFHYPSYVSPTWNAKTEMEYKLLYDRLSYAREVLAEWGEQRGGVFPVDFVDAAKKDQVYKYGLSPGQIGRDPNWIYTMGVDWNHNTGTQIVITGYNPSNGKIYVVDRETVEPLKWQQTVSVNKIIEMNRLWKVSFIYIDNGFGIMQGEALEIYGDRMQKKIASNPKAATPEEMIDANIPNILRKINFGGKDSFFNPVTMEEEKKPTKQLMVQQAMRRFENSSIHFPEHDTLLISQLLSYIEKRVTSLGVPVYESREPEKIGDHVIDALFLSLWAYTKELSVFSGPQLNLYMAYSPSTTGKSNVNLPKRSLELSRNGEEEEVRGEDGISRTLPIISKQDKSIVYAMGSLKNLFRNSVLPVSGVRGSKGKNGNKLEGPRLRSTSKRGKIVDRSL